MKQLLLAAFLAFLASAHLLPQQHVRSVEDIDCGIRSPPSQLIKAVEELRLSNASSKTARQESESIHVTVNMHAAVAENADDSYASEEILTHQFTILQNTCKLPSPPLHL